MSSGARPTLLVFTRGPEPERRRRRLLPSGHEALERELHRRCLDEAIRAGLASGCRVVVAAADAGPLPIGVERLDQRGRCFGERLAAAVEAVGGGPLLVVGTDTPDLATADLLAALAALEDEPERLILGPAPDGGVWLIGACGPLAGLLRAGRWCSSRTRASLVAAARAAGRGVAFLPSRADLDHRRDLQRWLARTGAPAVWGRLRAALRAVLAPDPRPGPSVLSQAQATAAPSRGRAPPV